MVPDRASGNRLPVERDRAGILPMDAHEYFHERRLAGAIFAEERMHLAGVQRKIDFGQNAILPEALADAAHLNQ